MPPNLGGFFMVRSYYPSECHADYFDFERIEALKPAIEACGISTLSQSPMLGFHKQMDNRIKLLEEILSFRMQGVEFDNGDMYVDGHKAASDVRDEFVSVTEKLMVAVATSQEAVQNQNEPQLRDENAHNDKSVHGVLNPTYQAGLRRDAVQPDIEAERKKRDEIEAGKSYCSRRFGGATCDDKSAQIYARFDKNDWRIQPAEFYRFHDAEVNTFGYF